MIISSYDSRSKQIRCHRTAISYGQYLYFLQYFGSFEVNSFTYIEVDILINAFKRNTMYQKLAFSHDYLQMIIDNVFVKMYIKNEFFI